MKCKYLLKLAELEATIEKFLPEITDSTGEINPQKVVDKALTFGTGSWTGPDWKWTLAGNGYVHSMLPSSIAGAGIGALVNAIRNKSILRGAGIGGLIGAGLGATHQYLYDTNRDYAFNNPFTKFTEWLAVPKDKDGIVDAYKLLTGTSDPSKAYPISYDSLRDFIYNSKGDPLKDFSEGLSWTFDEDIPVVSAPADKLRPHHLYYPMVASRILNIPSVKNSLLKKFGLNSAD